MELKFAPEAADQILPAVDATTDEDGYVIDKATGERVTNPDNEEVHIDNLAVVEEGSTIFVDDNFDSLVKHVERKSDS